MVGVKNVSSTMSIRRKSDNESIPKRDITIADDTWVFATSHIQCLAFFLKKYYCELGNVVKSDL